LCSDQNTSERERERGGGEREVFTTQIEPKKNITRRAGRNATAISGAPPKLSTPTSVHARARTAVICMLQILRGGDFWEGEMQERKKKDIKLHAK